jgi:hypothetical protein
MMIAAKWRPRASSAGCPLDFCFVDCHIREFIIHISLKLVICLSPANFKSFVTKHCMMLLFSTFEAGARAREHGFNTDACHQAPDSLSYKIDALGLVMSSNSVTPLP